MALSDVTVTFNLTQLLGETFDSRRTRAYVKTNVANGTLMDTSTGEIRLGDQKVTVGDDGTGSFTTWAPGADGNPTSWQTSLVVEYPRTGQRDRQVRTFGPYTITASVDLADLEEEQAVPAEYLTQVTDELQTYSDSAASSATSAAASASSASTSAGLAQTYRDQASEIALGDADAALAGAIENPASATSSALSASYAPKRATLTADQTSGVTAEIGKVQAFDATAGHLTVTLPTSATAGDSLTIQKADSSPFEVRVAGTINGVASSSLALKSRNDSVTLIAESASSWRPAERARTQVALPQQINVVGFAGDSITNASGATSGRGFVHLVRYAAGTRLVDQVYKVYATGGFTSAQVLATHIPTACAEQNLAVLHLAVGTNDAGTGVTVAQFAANVQDAYAQLMAAGKRMTISLIPPRGSGATAQWRKDRAAYNEWISRWAPLVGVPIADTRTLVDPATGYLDATCDSGDGTHPNDKGHALIAEAVATAVLQALPSQPHRQIKAPDVNSISNGTPTTVASGLPSGWSEVAGGTGDAPTYATVADTTGTLREGNWVEMTWNAATAGGTRIFKVGGPTLNTHYAANDQIEATATLQVVDTSGFLAALRAGTATVRFVVLNTSNGVQAVATPTMRALLGARQAYRFPGPNTSFPSLGIEVTIPTGVQVKVRAAEVGWFNLATLGLTKSTVGS